MSEFGERKSRQLARQIATKIDEPQRVILRGWIEQLLEVRASDASALDKAKKSISLTANSKVLTAAAALIAECAAPKELKNLTGELAAINSSGLSKTTKVTRATAVIAQGLKSSAWDNRGLKSRLALSAALAGAVFFGGQGAGIAALGTAIGVPLWVVFGAGAAFLGMLYEEISGTKPKTTYPVIEAERDDGE